MRRRKYTYLLIGSCSAFSIVVNAVAKKQGSPDPLSWGTILYEFGSAMTYILIGLSMILDYEYLLDWLARHFGWNPPSDLGFRVLGSIPLLFGLLVLALSAMRVLAALGAIPNPYLYP